MVDPQDLFCLSNLKVCHFATCTALGQLARSSISRSKVSVIEQLLFSLLLKKQLFLHLPPPQNPSSPLTPPTCPRPVRAFSCEWQVWAQWNTTSATNSPSHAHLRYPESTPGRAIDQELPSSNTGNVPTVSQDLTHPTISLPDADAATS